ncbi:MAG: pyruvate kinase [Kineosporiaceae bacterium]
MPQSLDALIDQLDDLLESLQRAETDHSDAIGAVAPAHRFGAVNLVHYTAVRRHDVRALQSDLMDMGVTSLSTAEANVRAKVRAARTVLAALRGDPGPWDLDAINHALDHGDEILATNSDAVFGPMRPHRPTRVMLTLPSEAAQDADLVASFVDAGMDVARVNCAHDAPDAWQQMASNVRAAASRVGRQVLVSMDLPGPKLRTGPIAPGPWVGRARRTKDASGHVIAPARLWLTPLDPSTSPPPAVAPAAHPMLAVHVDPAWLAARRVGDTITLRDTRNHRRSFIVSQVHPGGVSAEGRRNAYVTNGEKLYCNGEATIAEGIPPLANRLSLASGDRLVLTTDLTAVEPPVIGQDATIGCTLPQAITAMRPDDAVLFDDGAITAVVESTTRDTATLVITRTKPGGQRLGAEKGINLPDTVLPLPALTPEDVAYLPFIAEHADMVAVSFIRTAADVEHVLAHLIAADGEHLGLVLKIETRQGFENLPSILLAAMQHPRLAVMIARGDLAVEVGFERLAEIPRQILALCEAAHVPAIWATQVLETLAKTGQPSRAEITDAAAAQRADAVMLNKGPHILEAITTLDDILTRMDPVQHKSRTLLRHIHSWDQQTASTDPPADEIA